MAAVKEVPYAYNLAPSIAATFEVRLGDAVPRRVQHELWNQTTSDAERVALFYWLVVVKEVPYDKLTLGIRMSMKHLETIYPSWHGHAAHCREVGPSRPRTKGGSVVRRSRDETGR